MIYVRNKKEKITEFLLNFEVLILYTVTIDLTERLNRNDLLIHGVGF